LSRTPRFASRGGDPRGALDDGDLNCPNQVVDPGHESLDRNPIAVRSHPAKFEAITGLQFGVPGSQHWGVLVKRVHAAEEFTDSPDQPGLRRTRRVQVRQLAGVALATRRLKISRRAL
jgi:hypothetical protein